MKKFFSYIFILTITIGILFPTAQVNAQFCRDANGNTIRGEVQINPQTGEPECIPNSDQQTPLGNLVDNVLVPIGDYLAKGFAWVAYEIIIKITAWILGLSGLILDYTINHTIVQMSQNINAENMPGINTAWKLTRDLMNIAFIFLLVYEGILLIISQSKQDIKKLILGIVMASVFINFSLFFTKLLIDASNIVTIGLYNATVDINTNETIGNDDVGFSQVTGLSVPFMRALGFTSVFSNTAFTNVVNNQSGSGTKTLIFSIAGSALFLTTAFVFFAISTLFIVRYIVLIILLMISPIAYMGLALPQMKGYAKQWWDSLKGQLLFAPIYMFMTLVILTLISSPNFITNTGADWGNIVNPQGGAGQGVAGLIMNFAVIIGLAIASLVIAKSTALQGSKFIGQLTGKVSAFAGGVVFGTAGRIGRNTAGRVGNAIVNSKKMKDAAISKNFFVRTAARTGLVAGDKARESNFDLRGTSAFKSLQSSTTTNFGKPLSKSSYKQKLDDRAEKQAKFAKLLNPSADEYDAAKALDKTQKSKLEKEMKAAEAVKNEVINNRNKIQEEIGDIDKKIIAKQKELENAKLVETQEQIKKEIEQLQKESETKNENLKEINKLAEQNAKAHAEAKKAHDEYSSVAENAVKKIYENRVNQFADIIQNESAISRYSKNIFRIPLSLVTGVAPSSRSENIAIARKVRGVVKEKPKLNKKALEDLGITLAEEPAENAGEEKTAEGSKPEGGEAPKTA